MKTIRRPAADADLADLQGYEALRRDREVLSVDKLARAMARLPPGQADELIVGLRTLVDLVPRST